MSRKVKYDSLEFTLTMNAMNTIIEDTLTKNKVLVNNLCLVSLCERNDDFIQMAIQMQQKFISLESDLFEVEVVVFTNGDCLLMKNGMRVLVKKDILDKYNNDVLMTIKRESNFKTSGQFYLDGLK